MDWLKNYRLEQNELGEYELILYLNEFDTEFADESGHFKKEKEQDLISKIQQFIQEKVPDIKVKAVKVILGGVLLSTLPFASSIGAQAASTDSYTVRSGDSLWSISRQFNTSVDTIRSLNNLSGTTIFPNQTIRIPSTSQTYTVRSGDSLFKIASQFNTTVQAIRTANNLTNDLIHPGQVLRIGSAQEGQTQPSQNVTSQQNYVVKSGDTLWKIAQQSNTTVAAIRSHNNLTSDLIHIEQTLRIPSGTTSTQQTQQTQQTVTSTQPTVSYMNYTVKSGDNPWNIAINHRVPMQEVLKANNMSQNTALTIGQTIRIPVHHIPVKPVVSARHGELLNWWTEAQYVFAVNDVATVTDFETGRTFRIKRTTGAFHADSEPLTAADTEIARSIWGGFSWRTRPVIVEVNGRRLAASMSFMPHDVQYINNNNFNGHFDVHFLNSTRHADNLQDANHQQAVRVAAGINQ